MGFKETFRYLLERIFPPAYPQYAEYQSEKEAAVGEEVLKVRRLKVTVAILLVLSLPLTFYIYFVRTPEYAKKSVKNSEIEVPPEELIKRLPGLTGSGKRKPETLEDVKQWAAQLEREARQSYNDSLLAGVKENPEKYGGRMPSFYREGEPPEWKDELTPEVIEVLAEHDTEVKYSDEGSEFWDERSSSTTAPNPDVTGSKEFSGMGTSSGSFGSEFGREGEYSGEKGAGVEGTASSGGFTAARPSGTTRAAVSEERDSPGRYYHPKKYEPRTIEPRRIEPY